MKLLFYDPFAGISGDMHMGAMADLGVPEEYFIDTLNALELPGWSLTFVKDKRRGISGTRAVVDVEGGDHHHRGLGDIEKIISSSSLAEKIKDTSIEIFRLVARAEAKVHDTDIQKVHFHEVGAVDSIVDIVAAAAAIDYLNPDLVLSRPPELGSGIVKCAHGIIPVPAPATAEILQDVPCTTGRTDTEATTPTGAAILKSLVDQFAEPPSLRIIRTGYGIGSRDPDLPNVLRVFLAEVPPEGGEDEGKDTSEGRASIIECNLDDMNPEIYDHLFALLFRLGVMDVYTVPVQMKKNRPGTVLTVVAPPELEPQVKEVLFLETTTAGVRTREVRRTMLDRRIVPVETNFGTVRVKELYYRGERLRRKPEYEDLKRIAREKGMALNKVYENIVHELGNEKKEAE